MHSRTFIFFGIVLFAGFFLIVNSAFVVRQTEQALVLQFGEPKAMHPKPGLKFKVPFVQNVEFFDKRLIDFNAEPKEITATDQKRLIVDAFVRYRITDPLKFYQAVKNESEMNKQLNNMLESGLKKVLGSVPLAALISEKRTDIMHKIRTLVNLQAQGSVIDDETQKVIPNVNPGFGIEVVDVRIMRADLPQENSEAIYRRMQTEREREAKEFRAQGAEEAQRIRAKAERERTVLIAEAQKKAEITRGEGDAEATKIFAAAFMQDKEFFKFYRSMQAYRKTLSEKDTSIILSPKSEFLQHLDE